MKLPIDPETELLNGFHCQQTDLAVPGTGMRVSHNTRMVDFRLGDWNFNRALGGRDIYRMNMGHFFS
jgi:hypothetical protein